MEIQLSHDVVFVSSSGANAYTGGSCDLFGPFPVDQQLNNFAFTFRQSFPPMRRFFSLT